MIGPRLILGAQLRHGYVVRHLCPVLSTARSRPDGILPRVGCLLGGLEVERRRYERRTMAHGWWQSHKLNASGGLNRLRRDSGVRRTAQTPSLVAQVVGVATGEPTRPHFSTCADCEPQPLMAMVSGALYWSVRTLGCAELRCTKVTTFNKLNGPRRGTSCAASPPASSPRPASSSSQCCPRTTSY